MSRAKSDPLLSIVSRKLSEWGIQTLDSIILVGVSGGMDSMVLLHALQSLGHTIAATHVNYRLRGADSDLDAALVKKWCALNHIRLFEKVIDTKAYVTQHHSNIQEAARQIRYDWWQALKDEHHFTHVATAHHLNDDIESLLINLMRGTGLKGLAGIPQIRDFYIRPLLSVPHNLIEDYASVHGVPFRTDLSNETDAYLRNRIRHHLIPLMRDISNKPDPNTNFLEQTLNRIKLEWRAWEDAYEQWKNTSISNTGKDFKIISNRASMAFALRWLEAQGIPWLLAKDYLEGSGEGKILEYANMRVSKNNEGFYLEHIRLLEPVSIHSPGIYPIHGGQILIELVSGYPDLFSGDPLVQYVSKNALVFPLTIREIKPGDAFQPFGMKGQHKKLQDYFVDLKLEPFEKQQAKVLISSEKIVWVIGMRLDESARVYPEDQEVYKLQYIKEGS